MLIVSRPNSSPGLTVLLATRQFTNMGTEKLGTKKRPRTDDSPERRGVREALSGRRATTAIAGSRPNPSPASGLSADQRPESVGTTDPTVRVSCRRREEAFLRQRAHTAVATTRWRKPVINYIVLC